MVVLYSIAGSYHVVSGSLWGAMALRRCRYASRNGHVSGSVGNRWWRGVDGNVDVERPMLWGVCVGVWR